MVQKLTHRKHFKAPRIKKNYLLVLILMGILLLLIPLIMAVVIKYEWYNVDPNTHWWAATEITWQAQTFTVGTVGTNEDFTPNNISIRAYRSAQAHICNVGIRAVDGTGQPTGLDLASAKMNVSRFGIGAPGAWNNFTMLNDTTLSASTKYAIVLGCPTAGAGHEIQWKADGASPTYTGGSRYYSGDSGATWTENTANDFMFEVYGSVPGAASSVNVSLFYPENAASLGVSSINFTANVSVQSFVLKNSTFNVWFTNGTLVNQTTIAMASSNNTEYNISDFVLGNYKWNVEVCGENATATQCSWSNNNFTFEVGASILWNLYSNNVSETQRAKFIANISLLTGANLFAARLNYNGTRYLATKTLTDTNQYTLRRTIDIPLLSGSVKQNLTFFWEFEYKNGAEADQNSSTYSQVVNPLIFRKCNAAQTIRFWNITAANETSRVGITSILDGTFRFWLGTGTVIKNYSLDGTQQENNYTFCSNKGTVNVSSIINLKSAGYYERTFYFNKEKLSNATTNTTLYLLGTRSSIIVEVTNPGLVAQELIFLNVYRYYPELNEYIIIEKAKTDEFGQFVARLIEPNTVKYQFEFLNSENVVLKRTDDITIACRTSICVIPFVIEDTYADFERFENVTNFDYTLSFSNVTNIFTYTWNDVTGNSVTLRLLVQRIAFNGTTIVCNSTSTSSASTLTCDVGISTSKYRAQAFRKATGSGGDERRIMVLNIEVGGIAGTFGLEGLFWSFILLFTLIGVGSFNPSVGVGLYTIGFIGLGVIGIISMPIPIFFANLLLGVIFIWAIRT